MHNYTIAPVNKHSCANTQAPASSRGCGCATRFAHAHAHARTHAHTRARAHTHTHIHTRARARTHARMHARIHLVNAVSQSAMPWPSSHALHHFTPAHLNLTFTVTSNKRTDTAKIIVRVPSKHTDTAKIIVRVPGYRSGCVRCRH